METGLCVATYNQHTAAVTAIAWLPCGERFVSGEEEDNKSKDGVGAHNSYHLCTVVLSRWFG